MIIEANDRVVLIGTAHISPRSVQQVEEVIRERRPDRVLVELDAARAEALQDPERWRNTDIIQVIKQKKQHLFLLQLYLANMQARMGRETGVAPGAEMLRAIQVADEVGAEVVLMDRDIRVTLKRGFGAMGFWRRLRLFWKIWIEVLTPTHKEDGDALDVDAMLETDAITAMTEEFAHFAPDIKVALIDERDAYMAHHVQEQAAAGHSVVAVVGAGHLAGIERYLKSPATIPDRAALETIPHRVFTMGRILGVLVPAAILGVFVYLGVAGRYADLLDLALYWIFINGILSALGAILARGHILSAVTAFVAAPITSLNPALAAGWFAGLVEAKMHTPTVGAFEKIRDLETMKDFYRNDVVRVLLVTAMANLGSVIGTWVAGAKIVQTLVGGG